MRATLLDIQTISKDNSSIIELFLKAESGTIINHQDLEFRPYFYLLLKDRNDFIALQKDCEKYKIIKTEFDDTLKNPSQISKFVKNTITEEDLEKGKYIILKIYFENIKDLIECRQTIPDEIYFRGKFEYDLSYDTRYCLDKNIRPLHEYEINLEKNTFIEISPDLNYNSLALDIESLSCTEKDFEKNPLILISLYSPEQKIKKVIGYKKPTNAPDYFVLVNDEKEMILEMLNTIKESRTHFLITYNGDNFDLPYLKKRAKVLGISKEFESVLDFIPRSIANTTICYTSGIQHIDAYKMVNYLNNIGAINLIHLKLNDVYQFFFNKSKIDISYKEMEKYYNDPSLLGKFIEYNIVDSVAAYEIANNFLAQFLLLSQITNKSLQETIRSGSSNLIESLLMRETYLRKKIIPNKPKDEVAKIRESQSYEGGYVKEPEIGIHENICVLDFQSFHPSIIITFNISPESLNLKRCIESESVLDTDKFCQDKKSTIPEVLEKILEQRMKVKNEMKLKDPKSTEYKTLYAQQWSLKILLNSIYGYLAYARARWYCFECARSTLKYTHKYIHFVIDEAQKYNLKTIYSDTDSAFVIYKNKENVFKFLEHINNELPGRLHLSLDNFYKRGLFVEKKQSDATAKKRYAMIDEKNNIKITGFETVRRDWSNIAKDTQKQVLETILKTGDVEKASQIVKDAINALKERKVKNEDLIIINRIRKSIEGYSATGPHVAAAIKAKTQGYVFEGGELVEYIITNNGKTISERAQLAELTKEGDYDIDYYINNQVLPSVSSIFAIFKYDENKLLSQPSQKKLF